MSRRTSETLMGAVVLALATYFFITAYQRSGSTIGEGNYLLSARFNDITGISSGSDVRIGGVKVGSVQSLTLDTNSFEAIVHFTVKDSVTLSADTSAAIVGESLLGGKFIALTPGGGEERLAQGGEIEFTQSSVSLEQLLGKFVFSGGGVDDGSMDNAKGADDVEFALP